MASERDSLYVAHMLECIDRVEKYVADGRDAFLKSELIQDAVTRNLQVLAESSQRLSPDIRQSQSEIDWRAISGFRNVLVYDYLGVDKELIWLVIEKELPPLKKALGAMQKLVQ